jgi:hypothetical protein
MELRTKNDCAGKDQQQLTQLPWNKKKGTVGAATKQLLVKMQETKRI